jgi:hypothetical protein
VKTDHSPDLSAAGCSFMGLCLRLCSNSSGEQETKEAAVSRSGSALMALISMDLDAGPLVVQVAGAVAQHVQMH